MLLEHGSCNTFSIYNSHTEKTLKVVKMKVYRNQLPKILHRQNEYFDVKNHWVGQGTQMCPISNFCLLTCVKESLIWLLEQYAWN